MSNKPPMYISASFSPRPIKRPPMIAPGIDVKPPNINTGSAFKAIKESENCTPDSVPHIMPATIAMKPEIAQTNTQILLSEIPTDKAAWWSSATALKALPVFVYCQNKANAVTSITAIIVAHTFNTSIYIP